MNTPSIATGARHIGDIDASDRHFHPEEDETGNKRDPKPWEEMTQKEKAEHSRLLVEQAKRAPRPDGEVELPV